MAIVTTADFITPPVNDPFQYGQIAAANAISDVYAMGGEPKVCLNLVCFPSNKLPPEDLNQIIAGALDKITEAGAVLAGGHSVEDSEPKFGLSVVGIVHPDHYWTNGGARKGDALILTKPLGSGVLFNANLKNLVSPEAMLRCIETLIELNKAAAQIMSNFEIHSVTDVTGFGLAGHAMEMAKSSGVRLQLRLEALPLMDEAIAMYEKGISTGVNRFNKELVENELEDRSDLPAHHKEILYDPQTSGGLLVALPAGQADTLLDRLHGAQVSAASVVGEVIDDTGPAGIRVT